jgi:hypothetical protein
MVDDSLSSLSFGVDDRASFRSGDGTAETWLRTSIEAWYIYQTKKKREAAMHVHDIMLELDGGC